MKIRLCVIRHGQTTFNTENRINGQSNSPLTAVGSYESQICGAYLRKMKWDLVAVSDLGRTIQTLACFGIEGEVDPRLRDRDFGPWNARPYVEYATAKHIQMQRTCEKRGNSPKQVSKRKLMLASGSSCVLSCPTLTRASTDNPYYTAMLSEIEPSGVERYEELFERIERLIHDTVARLSTERSGRSSARALWVTHCSPVRMCAMVLAEYSRDEFPKDLRKCSIPNNSISEFIIEVDDETHAMVGVELARFASTKHLEV